MGISSSYPPPATLLAMRQCCPGTVCGSSPSRSISMISKASATCSVQLSPSHTQLSLLAPWTLYRWKPYSISFSFSPFPLALNLFSFQIVLPPHLERIREKLAENSHELWAVTRIEQGWTYGPVSVFSIGYFYHGILCCVYEQCYLKIFCNLFLLNQVSWRQQEAASLPGGFPESAWTREELQFSHVRRDTEVSQGPHLINGTVLLSICISNDMCDSNQRTLLALGCHVGMGDEKAEENLKRNKLPKTWAAVHTFIVIHFVILPLFLSFMLLMTSENSPQPFLIIMHCSSVTCRVVDISRRLWTSTTSSWPRIKTLLLRDWQKMDTTCGQETGFARAGHTALSRYDYNNSNNTYV